MIRYKKKTSSIVKKAKRMNSSQTNDKKDIPNIYTFIKKTWRALQLEQKFISSIISCEICGQIVYEKLHRFIVIFHIFVSGFFLLFRFPSLSHSSLTCSILFFFCIFSLSFYSIAIMLVFRSVFTLKDFRYQNFVLIPFCIS